MIAVACCPDPSSEGIPKTELLDNIVGRFGEMDEALSLSIRVMAADAIGEACDRGFVEFKGSQVPLDNPAPGLIWKFVRLYRKTINAPTVTPVEAIISTFKEEQAEMAKAKKSTSEVVVTKRAATAGNRVAAGQKLTREYKGKSYEVDVRADGFMMDGKPYRSLTAVAKKITGYSSISGTQFFGLANVERKAPEAAKAAAQPKPKAPAEKRPAKKSKGKKSGRKSS